MLLTKKQTWILSLWVAFFTFVGLLIGILGILQTTVNATNVLAYIGFSLLMGGIAYSLLRLRCLVAFGCFALGLLVGLIQMLLSFDRDSSGIRNLAGLAGLFFLIMIGLAVGLVAQSVVFLVKKARNKK